MRIGPRRASRRYQASSVHPIRKTAGSTQERCNSTTAASTSLKLTSLTAYNHVNRNDTANGDGTAFQIYTGQYLGNIGSFSEELRLAGEGSRYNWIVGGYYSNDKVEENQIIYIGNFSTATLLRGLATSLDDPRYTAAQTEDGFQATNQLGDFDNNSISGFANGQYQFTDTLKATGGVRFTSDRSHFDGCAADFDGNTVPVWNTAVALIAGQYPAYNVQPGQCVTFATPGPGPSGLVNGELDQNNVSWRVNLDYTPVENVLLYGAIARGFKSGAYPIIPANKELQYMPSPTRGSDLVRDRGQARLRQRAPHRGGIL